MQQDKSAFNSDEAFRKIALLLKQFDNIDSPMKLFGSLNQIAMEFCPDHELGAPKPPVPPQLDSLPSVIAAINKEIAYQDKKWGKEHNRRQTVEGHLLIMRKELQEAEDGWMKNASGRNSVEMELVQVVAVGVQALNNIVTSGKSLY